MCVDHIEEFGFVIMTIEILSKIIYQFYVKFRVFVLVLYTLSGKYL